MSLCTSGKVMNATTSGAVAVLLTCPASSDGNYAAWSDSTHYTVTVLQAASTTTVTCPAELPYDSYSHTCTAAVTPTGPCGAVSPGLETNANTYTETATCTPTDTNYAASTGSATLKIDPANQNPQLTGCYQGSYTGLAEGCAGVQGGYGCPASTSWTTYIDPTGGTVSVYCAGDSNHNGATATGNVQISQFATGLTVSCTPNPMTYSGEPLSTASHCTATVTGVGGAVLAHPPVSPASVTATSTISASYAGSTDYAPATGSTTWTLVNGTIDCSVKDSQGNVLSSGVQEEYGTVLNLTCAQPAISSLKKSVSGPGTYAVTGTDSATLTITNGTGTVDLTLSETVNHVTSSWSFAVNAAPVPVTYSMPKLPGSPGSPYYQYTYGVSAGSQTYPLPTLANGGIELTSGALVGSDKLNVKVEMYNPNTHQPLSVSGDPLTEAIATGGQQYELLPELPSTTKYTITFAPVPMNFVADYTAATIVEKNPSKNVWGPVQNIAASISALSQYSFTVKNKSGADVVWTTRGSDPTNFTISPSPCTTYRLGSSPATECTITVAFAPSNPLAVRSYTDQITIMGVDQSTGAAVYNTLVSPAVTDTLNAYVYNDNGITVASSTDNFSVGGSEVLFTIGNISGYTATLAAPKFSKASEFAVDASNSNCATTLATGNSCTLAVKYTPPARNAPAATSGYASMTIEGSITPIPGGRTITLAKPVVEFNLN